MNIKTAAGTMHSWVLTHASMLTIIVMYYFTANQFVWHVLVGATILLTMFAVIYSIVLSACLITDTNGLPEDDEIPPFRNTRRVFIVLESVALAYLGMVWLAVVFLVSVVVMWILNHAYTNREWKSDNG